jgi:hypothetical protein
MLSVRIVTRIALTATGLALAGSVAADAATSQQAASLPSLFSAAAPVHKGPAKAAENKATERKNLGVAKLANKHQGKKTDPAAEAPDASLDAVWPIPDTLLQSDRDTVAARDAMPAEDQPPLSAVVIGGQTVQVAAADEVNDLDRAADGETATAVAPPADHDTDRTEAVAARTAAPAQTLFAMVADDSAAATAQLMAVLGGALAAVMVAWLLLRARPLRSQS